MEIYFILGTVILVSIIISFTVYKSISLFANNRNKFSVDEYEKMYSLTYSEFKSYFKFFKLLEYLEGKKVLDENAYLSLKEEFVTGVVSLIKSSEVWHYVTTVKYGSAEQYVTYLSLEFDLFMMDQKLGIKG